jgi:hypothetical protein
VFTWKTYYQNTKNKLRSAQEEKHRSVKWNKNNRKHKRKRNKNIKRKIEI